MLVLARKTGEVIRIGDDIVLRVVEVRGKRVRIGIEAPPDVRILRDECLPSFGDFEWEVATAGQQMTGEW